MNAGPPPHDSSCRSGFNSLADRYERGRPEYPPRGIRTLVRALRIGPGTTTVELGAGTGKLTRAWGALGSAIVTIEPVLGMRERFAREVPAIALLPGTAESIPLPTGFADAVVVAQAFHWFRTGAALQEIHRVLRSGGGLGLVWNRHDGSVPWVRSLLDILGTYRTPRMPRDPQHWWVRFLAGPIGIRPAPRAGSRLYQHGATGSPGRSDAAGELHGLDLRCEARGARPAAERKDR